MFKAWESVIKEFKWFDIMNISVTSISYYKDQVTTVHFSVQYKHDGEYRQAYHIYEN